MKALPQDLDHMCIGCFDASLAKQSIYDDAHTMTDDSAVAVSCTQNLKLYSSLQVCAAERAQHACI